MRLPCDQTVYRLEYILPQLDEERGFCVLCDRLVPGDFEDACAAWCPRCHEDAVFGAQALRMMIEPPD